MYKLYVFNACNDTSFVYIAILVTTAVNADFCDVCRPHAIDGSVVPSDSDLYSVIRK